MATIATLVIPIATAPSGSFAIPVGLNSHRLAFWIPVLWTAADLKVQISNDAGTTWFDVMDAAAAVLILENIPTTGGGFFFSPQDAGGNDEFAAVLNALPSTLMRVVSVNTAGGADLVQGAARTIYLISIPPALNLLGRPADGGNI